MTNETIFLIEDEADIASLIMMYGENLGYSMLHAQEGSHAVELIEAHMPSLILLDLMLPGNSGFEVCRALKQNEKTCNIPIVIVSAKSDEMDIVEGLEIGATDFVTKPFSPKVLFSKIKAILRREKSVTHTSSKLASGDLLLEVDEYRLYYKGDQVQITLTEFAIIKKLIQNPGKVFRREELLDDSQHGESYVLERNIDVHIASLRKKLGREFKGIETVRGIGYRFKEPVTPHEERDGEVSTQLEKATPEPALSNV